MRWNLLPITVNIAPFILLKVLISFPNGWMIFENVFQCFLYAKNKFSSF